MNLMRVACAAVAVLLMSPAFLFAQTTSGSFVGRGMAGLGAGIALIGAGFGFGKIGSAALESMARQPEVADKVSASMITVAALLEGAAFFALIVCILVVFFA
jgi:F-type H+-transporting ATPase subunit c